MAVKLQHVDAQFARLVRERVKAAAGEDGRLEGTEARTLEGDIQAVAAELSTAGGEVSVDDVVQGVLDRARQAWEKVNDRGAAFLAQREIGQLPKFGGLHALTLHAYRAAQESVFVLDKDPVFQKYMSAERYTLRVKGSDGKAKAREVLSIDGPGQGPMRGDVAVFAAIALAPDGRPLSVLKAGDTRAGRVARGDDYVKVGFIAGRMDKADKSPLEIAMEEVTEEVGGTVLSWGKLGDTPVPTMPGRVPDDDDGAMSVGSRERDHVFGAVITVDPDYVPRGDGGGHEVAGLIQAHINTAEEAIEEMAAGKMSDGARAWNALRRQLDKSGYIPELSMYVQDMPPAVQQHFDTRGLGPAQDPRALLANAPAPKKTPPPSAPAVVEAGAAEIDGVRAVSSSIVEVGAGAQVVDGTFEHLAGHGPAARPVGKPYPSQALAVPFDAAKTVVFYLDAARGPMVRFTDAERGNMGVKVAEDGAADAAYRAKDVSEFRVPVGDAQGEAALSAQARRAVTAGLDAVGWSGAAVKTLGASTDASAGQTDMRFHFFSAEVAPPPGGEGFVPLTDALTQIRAAGQGDAGAENALLRLARDLGYVPTLGMFVDDVTALLTP